MNKLMSFCLTTLTTFAILSGCAPAAAQPAATTAPTTAPSAAVESSQPQPANTEGAILISTKPKTVTTEMEQVTLLIANNTDKTYSTDYVQKLEQLVSGQWKEVPLTNEAVSLALLVIPAGEIMDYSFDFVNHYAPLEKGTYRIMKTFVDDEGNKLEATCEFDLF